MILRSPRLALGAKELTDEDALFLVKALNITIILSGSI